MKIWLHAEKCKSLYTSCHQGELSIHAAAFKAGVIWTGIPYKYTNV